MNHDPEYQDRLERLIDQELKRMPPLQVPESLLQRVKSAIEEDKSKHWWQKPWTAWPRSIQAFFMASLLALAGSLVYALSLAPTDASAQWISTKFAGPYAAVDSAFSVALTLLNAVLLVLQTAVSSWLMVAIVSVTILYAASVALGVAWFRNALTRRSFDFKLL
ncbi:MAG: hypothetical protein JWM99_1767 [Verrucomicrobiales bacterium]|nr:hypothetical protein [Verrucomicrobiales bacterium]